MGIAVSLLGGQDIFIYYSNNPTALVFDVIIAYAVFRLLEKMCLSMTHDPNVADDVLTADVPYEESSLSLLSLPTLILLMGCLGLAIVFSYRRYTQRKTRNISFTVAPVVIETPPCYSALATVECNPTQMTSCPGDAVVTQL